MVGKIKINAALLLCMAFIFRLLFVNIGLFSLPSTSQTNKLLTKHFSTTQKRRRHAEATIQSNNIASTSIEVCEEDLDEDLLKANSPTILSTFNSFLKRITFISKLNHLSGLIKYDLYPKKYLTLSILRI